ncbi:MAG: amidohydrolase family protein [Sporichthyaceae bacterium]
MTNAPLLLTADRVWDGLAAAPIQYGFVLIEEGTIRAVGARTELGAVHPQWQTIDLPGATLMPGLIDGHVHLTFSAANATVAEYEREAAEGLCTLTLRAARNLALSAACGVTTVRDLGTLNEVAFAARAAVADGRIVGPRVLTSGEPITVTGGHCHWFSHQCDTPDDVRVAVRRQVSAGADTIKIFASGGMLTPRTNPAAPQFDAPELAACLREARRLGVPVAAHAHSAEAIALAVAAGVDTLEHCSFETADGGVAYDPAVGEAMAAAGIAFCPTEGDISRLADDPALNGLPMVQGLLRRLPYVRAAKRRLLAAGAPMLSGTDAGVPSRPFGEYPRDLAALVGEEGLGLTARQVLLSATSGAAEILRLPDTGVLAPGRRADLLAVDGDPLRDIGDLRRTRAVWVAGRGVPRIQVPERELAAS